MEDLFPNSCLEAKDVGIHFKGIGECPNSCKFEIENFIGQHRYTETYSFPGVIVNGIEYRRSNYHSDTKFSDSHVYCESLGFDVIEDIVQ